jgi:uncharacterized protein (DUF1501 family)
MHSHLHSSHRRHVLQTLGGLSLGAAGITPLVHAQAQAHANDLSKILVIFELSGGNDGLNTVVPYRDDAYYRMRPKLGIEARKLRKLDDSFGLHPGMVGFERLYKEGHLAIVHGCGYAQPSFSHFQSMAYWHTAAPNSGSRSGWVGRLADALPDTVPGAPTGASSMGRGNSARLINLESAQSLAVSGARSTPLVFEDPAALVRTGEANVQTLLGHQQAPDSSGTALRHLYSHTQMAQQGARTVGEALARYRSSVDYGLLPSNLPKVAALIEARHGARIYYAGFRKNAFDTHVQQADLHGRLLTYVSDAINAFFTDLKRIGRAEDCTLLVFSEFGRRPLENNNQGTDHGTAGPMFVVGPNVKGGMHGQPLDLTQLDATGNLQHTTDFRQVYSAVAQQWMGADAQAVLGAKFEGLKLFARKAFHFNSSWCRFPKPQATPQRTRQSSV